MEYVSADTWDWRIYVNIEVNIRISETQRCYDNTQTSISCKSGTWISSRERPIVSYGNV